VGFLYKIAAARNILLRMPTSACEHCALARANRIFGTDGFYPYQKYGYGKQQQRLGVGFMQDRRLRADGFSSAQHRNPATTEGAI
jgi:hypothetical protein